MNTENLLKEIEIKKQEIVASIQLKEIKKSEIYQNFDISDFLITYLCCAFFYFESNKVFFTLLISGLLLSIIYLMLKKLLPNKNLSFSYHIMSFFKREKINKTCLLEKRKIALEKQLDKDFLTKISLNMNKFEFRNFLRKCDGNVTLKKLEKEIFFKEKNNKRSQNIEELTDAIYEEHQHLITTIKKV